MSRIKFSEPERVVIDLGRFEGEVVWRYFVDVIFDDGTRCGMCVRNTHAEALFDARELAEEDGADLPIIDHTSGRLQ